MKVSEVNIHRVQIPLRHSFSQSNNSSVLSDSTIVEVITANRCSGFGESCPRLYVTGEDFTTVSNAIQTIENHLKDTVFDNVYDIRNYVMEDLLTQTGPAASTAIELALLDAWSKEQQTSINRMMGATLPDCVFYSGVVPMRSPEATAQVMQLISRIQFPELKLKIDGDLNANLARIMAIRDVFPLQVPLRVDVNCAWSWEDAMTQIPLLLQQGITVFEQVFPSDQVEEMARLQRYFDGDICLMADESLTTLDSALRLVRSGACKRFNLKISKHGGLFYTLEIYHLAQENGISCQLGAHFGETRILTAAGLVFTGLARNLTALEGGLGTLLLEYDLSEIPLQINSSAAISKPEELLNSPGWGVEAVL